MYHIGIGIIFNIINYLLSFRELDIYIFKMSQNKVTRDVKSGYKAKAHDAEKCTAAKYKTFKPVLEISDLNPFEYSLKPDLMKF